MIFSPEIGLDPGKLLDAMGWGYDYQRGHSHSAIQIGEAQLLLHGGRHPASVGNADSIPGREG
jgi:hypothetical protein